MDASTYFAQKAQQVRAANPVRIMLTIPTPEPNTLGPQYQLEPPIHGDSEEA